MGVVVLKWATVARFCNRVLRLFEPRADRAEVPLCLGCLGVTPPVPDCPHVRNLLRLHAEKCEAERLAQELRQALAQREATLAAARDELEEFIYSASHELRAPARQICSFAGLLVDSTACQAEADSAEYVGLIQNAAKRMRDLIDDLVQYSRLGRATLTPAEVDFRTIVDQVQLMFEPVAKDRLVLWTVGSMPIVSCDAALLRQALFFLIDNALKFSARKPRSEIEISCTRCPGEDVFYVRDNGVGFPDQQANDLFRVFSRLHSSAEFQGTGTGLAKVRRIIQRHGGRTWAEGGFGQGATVYFTLPQR